MFRTAISAALIAGSSHVPPAAAGPYDATTSYGFEDICQWITTYDIYGNWITVMECY